MQKGSGNLMSWNNGKMECLSDGGKDWGIGDEHEGRFGMKTGKL
jgi:hypothetical protein